jgi:hypothetical protein
MSSVKDLLRGDVVDGSGTANYIPKFIDTNTIGNSAIYESSGKIAIGTTTLFSDSLFTAQTNSDSGVYNYFINQSDGSTAASFIDVVGGSGADLRIGAYGGGHSTLANQATIFNHKLTGSLLFGTEGSERMRITSSGNVGIGTSSPSYKVEIAETTNPQLAFRRTGSSNGNGEIVSVGNTGVENTKITLGAGSNNHMTFSVLGSERMRIESDGGIFFNSLGGFSVSNSDVRYNTTSKELYYQTSSKRYKSEITDLESSLSKVNNLRPVRFKDNLSKQYATGMIAEEVAKIIPDVVFVKPIDGFDEPQIEGINYSDLTPFLIKAMQEQQEIINDLKARIEILENK